MSGSSESRRAVQIYIAATLLLTAISIIFYLSGFTARHPTQLRWVLFDPARIGSDITDPVRWLDWQERGAFVFNGSRVGQWFIYCPFGFFVCVFFISLRPYAVEFLTASTLTILLPPAILFWRKVNENSLAAWATVTAIATSYPLWFLFDRSNIEGILCGMSGVGIYLFLNKKYRPAALLFGLAASIKPFAGIFFLLLIQRRRYRDIAVGTLVVTALSVLSLAVIGPTFLIALKANLEGFHRVTAFIARYDPDAIGSDHSLFALIKQLIRFLAGWPRGETLRDTVKSAYTYYQLLCVIILGLSLFRLRKAPILNQVLGLSVLGVLLPPMSYDYTLISLYFPWAMCIFAMARGECQFPKYAGAVIMSCYAVLFTSQYYLLLGSRAEFGAQVKTVALVVLLAVTLMCPLRTGIVEAEGKESV